MKDVVREIVSIVADVAGLDEEEVTLDARLVDDLDIDSVKAIEIAVAVEKRFGVRVKDEDLPNLTTVGDIINLTETLVRELEDEKVGV